MSKVIPHQLSLEDSLARLSDLLRCASATAHESGSKLKGTKQGLALSTLYLIDMARVELKNSLQRLEAAEPQ